MAILGVILALKVPGGANQIFQGKYYLFHNKNISPHFDQISEKLNGEIQSYCLKSVIFAILGLFDPFEPLGL